MESGIYKITNINNGKFYVGSSVNINKRWVSHKCDFNKNRHPNNYLQNVYNKYGFDVFVFDVLEYCEKDELKAREQYYLDLLKPDYNILKTSYSVHGENHPMYGKSHSEETIFKIKKARSKQVVSHSDETKRKISESNKGRCVCMNHIKLMISKRSGVAWNKGLKTGIEPKNKKNIDKDLIIPRYLEGDSIENIRIDLNISWDVVKRVLIDNNIKTRSIREQKIINDKNKNNGIRAISLSTKSN